MTRWELCLAAYAGGVNKVYVDIASDSVCFPSLMLLWHWQKNGDDGEVNRIARGHRVHVLNDGTVWSVYDGYRWRINDVQYSDVDGTEHFSLYDS